MGVKVEEQWRFKRKQSEAASRSAFAFKINSQVKARSEIKMSYGYGGIIPYSREVVIKITGGALAKKGIKNTIEYISRDYQIELVDREGNNYNSKEEIKSALQILQKNAIKADGGKKLKLTHNIVFSAPRPAEAKKEHILQASIKALKEKYPENYFIAAYHDETKNSHVHVVLNINKDNGERINIRKKDLTELRKGFCQNLLDYGYDVKANRKYEKWHYAFKKEEFEEVKRDNRNIYEVIEFGTISYQLDKRTNNNNYLLCKTANNKEVTIWGKEILNKIIVQDIRRGDLIKIKKTGETKVKVPVYSKDSATIIAWKEAKRNNWSIEKANNNIDNELKLNDQVKVEQGNNEDKKEIKLDTPEQKDKQYAQRQKFEHEKKLLLEPEYKREFELKIKLEQELKRKHKFSW